MVHDSLAPIVALALTLGCAPAIDSTPAKRSVRDERIREREAPPQCRDEVPAVAPQAAAAHVTLEARSGVLRVAIEPAAIELEVPLPLTGEHYSGARLEALRGCRCGEWDPEFAQVVDAALPFDRLALQIGSEPFCGGDAFSDAHIRVYVLDGAVDELGRSIAAGGAAAIAGLAPGNPPSIRHRGPDGRWVEEVLDAGGPDPRDPRWIGEVPAEWTKVELSYPRYYHDYGGTAQIDVFLRRFGDATIAIAVMHTGSLVHYGDDVKIDHVAAILRSVRRR